jgi:hypothetical protein
MHENAMRLLDEERIREILLAPASMAALNELYAIEVETLSKASKIDYLGALQRQMSFLQEWSNRVMISLAGVEEAETFHSEEFMRIQDQDREEIAATLRVAPATAQMKLDTARLLANHLPLTSEALATGEISPAHASVIARETERAIRSGITPEAIARIEERAISHAEMHTPGQVANKVKALIAKVSPEEFEEAVEAAIETRRVEYYPESDGMATVLAILPAAEATMLKNALDAMAQMGAERDRADVEAARGDTDSRQKLRTMDQRRADALAEMAAKALNDLSDFYKPQRRPVTVNITMDLATAMGLAENPAMLSGYGPIPASIARELAADGKWRRFVTEPESGNLLDYGRQTYEPPQILRDFLMARDRTCRFPGCRRPAHLTDIDHSQSWEEGGHTSRENLGLLCRRHHRLKTHGGWRIESHADGACTWTSPQGKVHHVPARPVDEVI